MNSLIGVSIHRYVKKIKSKTNVFHSIRIGNKIKVCVKKIIINKNMSAWRLIELSIQMSFMFISNWKHKMNPMYIILKELLVVANILIIN